MIKNAVKTGFRHFAKNRQFTLLNLMGLATGIACVLLIYWWVSEEWSVDKFNEKDSMLYTVLKTTPNRDGTIGMYGSTQALLGRYMAAELPEVEDAVAVRPLGSGVVSEGDKHLKASTDMVDNDFFKVFSYRLIEGNRQNPFADRSGVLISDKLALKLFNTTQNIIGKRIDWDGGGAGFNGPYAVAGVFEAPPANATAQFDLLLPYELYIKTDTADVADWGSNGAITYITLKKGVDAARFSKKIKDYTKDKIRELYKDDHNLLRGEGDVFLQRYSDGYLFNHYENGVQSGGRIEYVRLFSLIAIFILVIACINFMNLSTARASGRIKEVGIKKAMGAGRGSLILQFMGESMLMALLSLLLALLLVTLLLPSFNAITGKELHLQFSPNLVLAVIGITFITGMIAGSYPAVYLSGFRPALGLSAKMKAPVGQSGMRKGLVVFQFAISIVLMAMVAVVYKQMNLIQTINLGYNRDHIVHFSNEGKLANDQTSFLAEVRKIPGVAGASSMSGNMTGGYSQAGTLIEWEGKPPGLVINFTGLNMEEGMMEVLGMQMKEGRMFSHQFGSDSSAVILNESAIAAMGIKDPVGKIVTVWRMPKRIIGVVKDFHFGSLYKKVTPFFLRDAPNNSNTFVRIKVGTEKQTLGHLEQLYKQYNQGLSFEYRFLDDDYQLLYSSEQKVAMLSRYFAGMAILISCLGLFGLTAFTAQKRQKEIAIRKTIGASVSKIVGMLAREFLTLVVVALLIALPVAWWLANAWLLRFAYRVRIGPAIFLLAAAAILLLTALTVSYQAVKAAVANPVKSLRTE